MKFLSNLVTVISVIIIVWLGINYAEILCKQGRPNPKYSDANIIVNSIEWAAEHYDYDK